MFFGEKSRSANAQNPDEYDFFLLRTLGNMLENDSTIGQLCDGRKGQSNERIKKVK